MTDFLGIDLFSNWQQSGPLLQIFIALLAGILSSLTPCVYPLIPVTVALFSLEQENSTKFRRPLRALTYALGLASCYTVLGLLTSLGGGIFGQYLGSKWFLLLIVLLLILMALQSIEIIRFRFLDRIQNLGGRIATGSGYLGFFVAGAISGLIAAPCVGPVLVLILAQVAAAQNLLLSVALMIAFSIGLSLLFLVLALFSGLGSKLPRAGNWFYGVKFIISVGLLVTAIYFLRIVFPDISLIFRELFIWPLTALSIILTLVTLKKVTPTLLFLTTLATSFTIATILFSATPTTAATLDSKNTASSSASDWQSDFNAALVAAKSNNQALIVDLYADWCVACAELDHQVLQNAEVLPALSSFIKVRLDFSIDSNFTSSFAEKYSVLGLPCILFLDSNGNEIQNTRVTGLVSVSEFLKNLELANKSNQDNNQ
jgi:thiol:disulfide interchange protein DsbD